MNLGIATKKKNWKKILLIIVAVVIVLTILIWQIFEAWYRDGLKPVAKDGTNKVFVVDSGQSPDEIANNLESSGLIKDAHVFTIYLDRTSQRAKLQAGTYSLNPIMTTNEIADIIASGKVDVRLTTIVPGLRLDEVQKSLVEAGFDESEVKAAFAKKYDHPLLKNKPKKASLEGYIYPESFQITSHTPVEDLVIRSFDEFWSKIDDSTLNGIRKQGLSFHEAIILASIVGRESADEVEQKKIAQVFLRRLKEDIPLGADPTFYYAAAIKGVEPDTQIDSPYNTRIYKGLPPGPIANFNYSALEAVAKPANTNYLYFVAGDDGITRFSYTEDEHQALIDKYCIELCKL